MPIFNPRRWIGRALALLLGLLALPAAAHAQTPDPCAAPANPVVAENCQPGSAEWRVAHYQNDIAGFASAPSVAAGETLRFFVNTDAPRFDLLIFRSGYYGGAGGRLIQAVRGLPGQVQPACQADRATGLASCANWTAAYELTVPAEWVSGIYLAKLVRPDTGGENYSLFVVRDDARRSDLLVQIGDFTYQAYSNYGGKSLYTYNSSYCPTAAAAPRAVKVSLDRPYQFPTIDTGNTYFFADQPMVYWLEAQGYDLSYSSNWDTHRSGLPGARNRLLEHKAFLAIGHDEYWTQPIRDAITAARDAGVHLAFFSANTSYWRVRLEPDPWTGEPDRVLVTYKTTESGGPDPSGQATGTWRDPAGAAAPENALLGVQYRGDNDTVFFPLRVTAEQAQDRLYRNTGLAALPPGTYADIGHTIMGWEWDAVADNGRSPAGLQILAASPVYGALLTDAGHLLEFGTAEAHTTRYVAPSGATVFSSGTILWSWGLAEHDPDPRLQQITYNLLADLGAQPATPAATLILDSQAAPPTVPPVTPTRPEPGDPPQAAGVDLQPSDAGVTIAWTTDRPARGQVWIKPRSGAVDWRLASLPGAELPVVLVAAEAEAGVEHTLTLAGLRPATTYYAQFASTDAQGRTGISPEYPFTTAPGALTARLRNLLRPWYQPALCWTEANPQARPLGLAAAGLAGLAVIGLAWRGLARRRR
ncbi:MAG: fibronectin type III domain-containing protein, partial [Anaerolineales bacterium]|nr:fibronectin type III domain-containing protein [Anaerolineales bacterium]